MLFGDSFCQATKVIYSFLKESLVFSLCKQAGIALHLFIWCSGFGIGKPTVILVPMAKKRPAATPAKAAGALLRC